MGQASYKPVARTACWVKGSWTQSQPSDLLKFTCNYLKVVSQITVFLFLKKNHDLTNHKFVKSVMVFVGLGGGGWGVGGLQQVWGWGSNLVSPYGEDQIVSLSHKALGLLSLLV